MNPVPLGEERDVSLHIQDPLNSRLVRVREAAQALRRARSELRLALEGARPHHTLEELGKAAGVTRQAVHLMLRRKEEK